MTTLTKANRFNYQGGEIQSIETTPQGGIRVKAAVCRAGILEYRNTDGSIRRELHLPEEIFSEKSVSTLNSATVTLMHPDEMVNSDNYHMHSRGHVAEGSSEPSEDSQLLLSTLVIQDSELVLAVLNKELTEISPGYICDVEMTSGLWGNLEYDAIQRNIQYNHIAIGPQGWGRSGPEVSIRLDCLDELPTPKVAHSNVEEVHICTTKDANDANEQLEIAQEETIKTDSSVSNEIIEETNASDILFTTSSSLEAPVTEPTKASKIIMKPSNRKPYIAKSSQISTLEAEYKALEAKFLAAQKKIDELEVVAEQATEQAKAEAQYLSDLKLTAEKFGIDTSGIDTTSAMELKKAVILEAIPGFEFPEAPVEEEMTSEEEVEVTDAELDETDAEKTDAEDMTEEDMASDSEEEVKTDSYEDAYIQGAYDVAVAVLMIRQASEVRVDSRLATFEVRSTSDGKKRELTLAQRLAETRAMADQAQARARDYAKNACK